MHYTLFHLRLDDWLTIMIIATYGLAFWLRPRALENLGALAGRLGLQIGPRPDAFWILPRLPTIEGRHRGRDVRFLGRLGELGENRIVVAAKYAGDGGFILYAGDRGTILHRPLYSFRFFTGGGKLQPVFTEDADFDRGFFFKTTDPLTAKNLLTPEVRRELLDVYRQPGGLTGQLAITEGEVRYTLYGRFSNPRHVEMLAARLDLVCGLAEQVEKCGQPTRARLPLSTRNPKQK